jgi:methionine-gamma-lyase
MPVQPNFQERLAFLSSKLGLQIRAVHAGEQPDPATGASSSNLVMSTTYVADPDTTFSAEGFQEEAPHIYTRWSNPTLRQLEERLCTLEGAEACVVFASGMAAIYQLFNSLYYTGSF